MITYVVADLFQSPARVLVNTVNTVGVMGKGVAKVFKDIYPEMFLEYQKLCEGNQFDIGQLWLYKTPNKWILNFPTKKHWRSPSKPEYIAAGLKKFVDTYSEYGIMSISFPLLGCGNGEMDWQTQVRPIMEKHLKRLPIEVFIHLYQVDPFTPEQQDPETIKAWLRNEPQTLAFSEVWDDLRSIIRCRDQFTTLDNREVFHVEVDMMSETIVIKTRKKGRVPVHNESLLDLWQHIRGFGFCMQSNMPSSLDSHGWSYITAIMAELPYLKPALLSPNYREVSKGTSKAIGLRLLPQAISSGKPLFSRPQELERV